MAYQDITSPGAVLSREITLTRNFFAGVGAWFSNAFTTMHKASSAQRRFELTQQLQAKTDAELAEMRINREDIVHHVFGDLYYV